MVKLKRILLVCVFVSFCIMFAAVAQNAPAAGAASRGGGMGMGGGIGGRGTTPASVKRPDKAARLAALEELQKQIETLKAAIQKAPPSDPCISQLQADARTTFMNQYTEESTAINSIITSLNTMRPVANAGTRSVGGLTIAMVTELKKLAQEDKSTKLTARLDVLTKQIQEQTAIRKTQIADGVYQLVPPATGTPVNMYLVIGTQKALLVDTAYPGDITPADVEEMTKLPYMVVNTHAHPDHDGSNNAFKKIYVSAADLESARRASGNAELVPIKEGYVFDLGGKKLEVIEVPGHTVGSICLLDAQDKLLITGDTANPNLLMNLSNVSMDAFKKNMEHLLKWKDQYNLSLAGHGGPFPVSYITDTIACAQEIIDGKVDTAQPAAGGAAAGRGGMGGGATHTYGNIRITYNPNNIRENK
jgi:hydroxyacylglutathione hydrolase